MASSQLEINKSARTKAVNTLNKLLQQKETRFKNTHVKQYLILPSTVLALDRAGPSGMDNCFHALPTELLLLVCDFLEDPTDVCCLALSSTRLAQVAARKSERLVRESPLYERANMLRAPPEGFRICDFCWKARASEPEYWEWNKNDLSDWQFVEQDSADFDASVVEFINDWCEGEDQTGDNAEEDEPFPLAWAAARCLQEAYGMKSQEDLIVMGRWCPPCSVQIVWEGSTLSNLLADAGYQEIRERGS